MTQECRALNGRPGLDHIPLEWRSGLSPLRSPGGSEEDGQDTVTRRQGIKTGWAKQTDAHDRAWKESELEVIPKALTCRSADLMVDVFQGKENG